MNRILSVLMNGVLIGKLEKIKGSLKFTYDETWLTTEGSRPISLSLPLKNQSFEGDVVYNFFDNLLPDNTQIRARIQAKFQIPTNQPFDLLAMIGRDCVGAIQLIEGEIPKFKQEIKCQELSKKNIAELLRGYQKYPLGMINNHSEFRISIAGAQEKFAFLYHGKKWCRPVGETPTSHIFKLPIGYIAHQHMDLSDSCENEWLCLKILDAFGLPVAKSKILSFGDMNVLVVERFDRKLSSDKAWLMRLPQEDAVQALGVSPNLKYQGDGGPGIKEIMKLLLGSKHAILDRDVFFKAQIIFWLLAAIDGHAKNFSISIESGGEYSLTPLYDVISAYPLVKKKQLQAQKLKMAMALRGKKNHYHWYNVHRRHFLETAKYVDFSVERAEKILDKTLSQVNSVIKKIAAELPKDFPKDVSLPIFEGLKIMKRKLTKGTD